jgi:hypothetical protein
MAEKILLLLLLAVSAAHSSMVFSSPELCNETDKLRATGRYPELFMWIQPYPTDSIVALVKKERKWNMSSAELAAIYNIEKMVARLANNENISRDSTDIMQRIYLSTRMELSYTGEGKCDTIHTRGIVGAEYTFGKFVFVNKASVDAGNGGTRFDHITRKYKGDIAADMPEAYLAYRGKTFSLLAGRNRYSYGIGRSGSLLLGNHGPSLNGIVTSASIGFLKGDAMAVQLEPYNGVNRWFSAMRVGINISNSFSVALMQSVVYAGAGRRFELGYALPSFLYYFTQYNDLHTNETDNIFLGMQAEYRFNGGRAYGEILADDFQVDNDSVSRGVQNAVAFMFGVSIGETLLRPSICAEYVRINSYVYKHMGGIPTHYMLNMNGGTLGHPLGPDAEALYLYGNKTLSSYISAGAEFAFKRLGSLNDPAGEWDAYGKASQPIPMSPVEKRYHAAMVVNAIPFSSVWLECGLGVQFVESRNNDTDFSPMYRIRSVINLGKTINFKQKQFISQ